MSVLKDLICPVCKTRGIPITSAAWIASWTPVWVSADTHCRACGANVRFPVVSQPVGWLLVVPCLFLIGAEFAYLPIPAFLLAPLTVVGLVFVPPYVWRLQPVIRQGEATGRGERVCPACHRPGIRYGRALWELWVTQGRTRCSRCGVVVRLSHWTFLLAPVLLAATLVLVLQGWTRLSPPLATLLTVALPTAWFALPPRWLRLHAVRKRE